MSDLSISRQKAAKIIFPSHPDPSPPPYLRDGELMRFLFFYFFLYPSSSREEEKEREEGPNPEPPPPPLFYKSLFAIPRAPVASLSVVWLSLSPGEIRKGKKRQTNVLSERTWRKIGRGRRDAIIAYST